MVFYTNVVGQNLRSLLGVFFPAEDPQGKTPSAKYYKGIHDMKIQPEDDANRSLKLWLKKIQLSIMMKAKDDTDLRRKRLSSP
jgi:hypothetical protein